MAKPNTQEAKKGGVPNQAEFYSRVASRWDRIMAALDEGLESRNPAIRIGSARTLLNKILPDIKSVELTGKDGEPIKFNIISGSDYLAYVSKLQQASTASNRSIEQLPGKVQSINMASESKKDDNSNNTVGEVGAS